MKTLILSVSAGGGHVHAANAVKEYIMMNSPDSKVEIIDTLKFINPLVDKFVIGSYLNAIKTAPVVFGMLYHYTESDYMLSPVTDKFNYKMGYKILPTILEFNPDVIIATHPIPAYMLSILKYNKEINVPVVTIMTDYASHNLWLHQDIEAYVVSNSDMIDEMVSHGIDRKIIYDYGIPVSPNFIKYYNKEATLSELGLDDDKPTLLVMGGSLGMGKISNVYNELLKVKYDIQIIVITGNNKKLLNELKKVEVPGDKKVKLIGFSKEVNKLMQASDLLLTKPGGLTITEALICCIPLAIFSPIPGQEEKNCEFLLDHNLAIDLYDGKNCRYQIEELLSSQERLKKLKENCLKYCKPDAGKNVYKLVESLVNNLDIQK